MIDIYEAIYDENLNIVPGRTKLFIKESLDDGAIGNHDYGIAISPEQSGTMFIVDDWLIPQINKILFINGELIVKDGEKLIHPEKSEKELKREELLRQIAELDATEDETVDIEEQTE